MNRREFLASVAALGGVAFGLPGNDPEIPVVACEEWYGIRIAYRYAWAWCDGDVVCHSHGTEALTPTDNPYLFRARLSEMRAMRAENRKAEQAKLAWSKFHELPLAGRDA